jgi:hypothetical protein
MLYLIFLCVISNILRQSLRTLVGPLSNTIDITKMALVTKFELPITSDVIMYRRSDRCVLSLVE